MVHILRWKFRNVTVPGLFAAVIHRSFTILVDCALLCLLGVLDSHVRGVLKGCMTLEHLVVILLLTGVRGVMMGRRGMTACKHLASSAPLGGPDNILPMLAPFLVVRVHPEIREIE
jgi:hypothetical protein